jgi:hypothetical protein
MDFYDEQIAHIMEHFDFDKVQKVMLLTGWKWQHYEGTEGYMAVPGVDHLRKRTRELLENVCGEEEGATRSSSTGGFIARNDNSILSLEFILEDADGEDAQWEAVWASQRAALAAS